MGVPQRRRSKSPGSLVEKLQVANQFYDYDRYDTKETKQEIWRSLCQEVDTEEKWRDEIYKQIENLAQTRTGRKILELIATLWHPREISITNKDSTRLTANVNNNVINIPSVPRSMCYRGKGDELVATELWMILGHELLHLIHRRLNLHLEAQREEQNTIQGIMDDDDVCNRSFFNINGELWHLTENEFRHDKHVDPRNGYDSVCVCSSFDKSGCQLFSEHGANTCSAINYANRAHSSQ